MNTRFESNKVRVHYSEKKNGEFRGMLSAIQSTINFVLRAVIDISLSLKHFKWIDPPFPKHRL